MQPQHETSADNSYDVVIIGGAFAGASTALLLRRELPEARILVVERKASFDRKVGEATVEVSANFLHRVLGLYDYLSREHLPKHGLRFWFSDRPDRTLGEMTEIGSTEMPRLPSFQLDRSRLDESLLASAADGDCEIARPARVLSVKHDWPASEVRFTAGEDERTVSARWIIDASGRRTFIARERGVHQTVEEHPTAAVWARWHNARDLDSPTEALPAVHASRRLATNHFCGYGWWCWVIPLAGGQTSIGLVYNKELFDLRGDDGLRERYERFIAGQPGLREMLNGATLDESDFHAFSQLPYRTTRYMDRGWGLVGDAASFMDPYYSPGLDHAAFSVYATTRIVASDIAGQLDDATLGSRIDEHNDQFLRSFDRWLSAIYVGKYELMGDAELTRCAFLLDTSLYYLGIVGPVCAD
ncbi:MAG: NAD(P)/FAD-dependent oxidoreductase, partial [Gammaproteobacteria bacterium]